MVKIRSVSLPGFDPYVFLQKLPRSAKDPVLMRAGKWTVLTWAPESRIEWGEKHEWEALKKTLKRRRTKKSSDLPFVGGAIGYASYDLGYELQNVKPSAKNTHRLPLLSLGLYDHAICFDGQKVFVVGDDAFMKNVRRIHVLPLQQESVPQVEFASSITRSNYAQALKKTHRWIYDGEVYQLNETYQLRAKSSADHRSLFIRLARKNPTPRAAYIETPSCSLLSLSPEQFVDISDSRMTTMPIKGTRPRGKTKEEDVRLRRELLASTKEAAELAMITDLLRNDIGRCAVPGSVRVTGYRLLQALTSVWHTYSIIEAALAKGMDATDVLRSMLPAGSVTGCPKARAMELIDELETERRGPYTGVMLMLSDDGSMKSSIIIRTIVAKKNELSLGVGGGIVADSVTADEFAETRKKAAPFLALAEPQSLAWIDGKKTDPGDTRFAEVAKNNPSARGAFETMRARDGRIAFLSEHMQRLGSSAQKIGIRLPKSLSHIRSMTAKIAKQCPWDIARIRLACTDRNIFAQAEELVIDPARSHGVSLLSLPLTRSVPSAKALPYHRETAAQKRAARGGCEDALLLDKNGRITEAAYSNVFWVKNGTLFTPDKNMLQGIMRGEVLRVAKKLGIAVGFASPTLEELKKADEVFITRATAGVVPVVRIGKTRISSGTVGRIMRKLQVAFEPVESTVSSV